MHAQHGMGRGTGHPRGQGPRRAGQKHAAQDRGDDRHGQVDRQGPRSGVHGVPRDHVLQPTRSFSRRSSRANTTCTRAARPTRTSSCCSAPAPRKSPTPASSTRHGRQDGFHPPIQTCADRREQVVADGVADDGERAPFVARTRSQRARWTMSRTRASRGTSRSRFTGARSQVVRAKLSCAVCQGARAPERADRGRLGPRKLRPGLEHRRGQQRARPDPCGGCEGEGFIGCEGLLRCDSLAR
jgi:hypothetical protein